MLEVVEQGIVKIQQGISCCMKLMQDCLETGWSKFLLRKKNACCRKVRYRDKKSSVLCNLLQGKQQMGT